VLVDRLMRAIAETLLFAATMYALIFLGFIFGG
jgi:hypothetical protein